MRVVALGDRTRIRSDGNRHGGSAVLSSGPPRVPVRRKEPHPLEFDMPSALSKWHGNQWAILITLSLGFFMTLLDLTIVNIAIPSMITDLDASLDEILWVVNAYVLVLAVLLITAGRLGDLRGQRKLFVGGVVVFTLASLACGLAPNPNLLIAF